MNYPFSPPYVLFYVFSFFSLCLFDMTSFREFPIRDSILKRQFARRSDRSFVCSSDRVRQIN